MFPAQAHAQRTAGPSIYTCIDAEGRRYTSDRPMPECADRDMRELRSDGALKRRIPAPLTRTEREQRAAEAAAQRVQEMRERQRLARDRALLRAYPSLDDLYALRDKRLAEIQAEIDATFERMLALHKELSAAQSAARRYPKAEVPAQLNQNIARLANEILAEDTLVKSRQLEQEQVRARFDGDAARLRELLELAAEAERKAG
jgi:hypothetical protein